MPTTSIFNKLAERSSWFIQLFQPESAIRVGLRGIAKFRDWNDKTDNISID